MLTIRLLRTGKKHQPSYKIVVTDKRNAPAGGRFVEEIGNYDPKTKLRNIKKERALYWISVGAQPSDTVHNMLVSEKVIDQPKRKKIFTKPEPALVEEKKPEVAEAKTETPKEETVKTEEVVAEEQAIEEPVAEETVKTEEVVTEEPVAEEVKKEEVVVEEVTSEEEKTEA